MNVVLTRLALLSVSRLKLTNDVGKLWVCVSTDLWFLLDCGCSCRFSVLKVSCLFRMTINLLLRMMCRGTAAWMRLMILGNVHLRLLFLCFRRTMALRL